VTSPEGNLLDVMYGKFKLHVENTLDEIREAGLYKSERVNEGPQDERIRDKIASSCKL
jgi:hypothetical protein